MPPIRFFIAATALASSAASAGWAKNSTAEEVQAVDAAFRKAMVEGDARTLDRIVADDATIIHGDHGGIQDKAGLLRDFRAYHIERYERTPVAARIGGDMAVLVSITRKVAGARHVETTTTEVLVRRAGRWQILILQNTDHAAG